MTETARAERLPPRVTRYLPARVTPSTAVFHTSYYRLPNRPVDRYVASVYDFTYERYRTGLARAVHHRQKAASILSADVAICISQATRADLLDFLPKVDPARALVVPLAVDHSVFFPDPGPATDRPYVLFVGQRGAYKRFNLAVAAVSMRPDLALAIVGPPLSDDERAWLKRALPGRWIEHGGVGPAALRRLYSDAHAFIFPSDYEGFGLPILEAMACGCPVVAADRSSFPEVAGQAALLAPHQAADAYATLLAQLEDDAQRQRLVSEGRVRAGLSDWSNTFSKLWPIYR